MKITLIAAMGKNREIGQDNKLLWNLPEDMKHFQKRTKKKTVIMGRKTYDSIGKPLPNRDNIILSRNTDLQIEGVNISNDIEKTFQELEKSGKQEVMIIGGASIYEESLYFCTHMSLTYVDADFPKADSFFPAFNSHNFFILSEEYFPKSDKNPYSFTIQELKKK